MRIAVVAHIRHPIRRPFMGGMEAHAWSLADALTGRGHDVTLVASGDSDERFRLAPIVAEHYDRDFPWHDFHGTDALNTHLDDAFARGSRILRTGEFDIIHNNSLHRFPPRLGRQAHRPMLTSLHVPPFGALRRAMQDSLAPWCQATVTSRRQLAAWWSAPPKEAHVVPNGIDLSAWPYQPHGTGEAVWAGRITPTKGVHVAVRAARLAGCPLTLFGTIEHRDYYETEVKPHLGGAIRYGGHLDMRRLAHEIGRASVLLFTPLWDEPFGLAAIEAMACGVPVAALDNGAVREVIGPCGAYAEDDSPEALAKAIPAALAIPRADVHTRARQQFSIETMVTRYERLYALAMDGLSEAGPGVRYAPHELALG
ncbi:glycosyltransferase [Aestuariibius insulae]|uniref:glycosyltransferase n=1 Tax=Aestuariibius insulae TaxID=2058287 RepID=UPI00398E5FD5